MSSEALSSLPLVSTEIAPAAPPVLVRGLPFVGVLPSLLRDAPGTLLAAARRHPGELFALKLGPVQVPVVARPEHLQQVLISDAQRYTKGGMWSATKPLLGDGLVTSDGEHWKRQRRLMQPLFHQRHLGTMAGLMADAITKQAEELSSRASAPVELGHEMTLLTQRVLMETMFGESLRTEEAWELGRLLQTAFQAMNLRIFLYFLPSWVPLPGGRAFHGSIARIDEFLARLVAERRARPTERADILNQLLAARDPDTGEAMSDRQIRDELITLFVAGLDTTAVTLTWMFWLLDRHPEVDRRLRLEVDGVLGGRAPTTEDLPRLVYTGQVIREAMRLYPPAWIFPRFARDGAVLGGRHIEAGTSLLISPYVTHRDPTLWENPDEFDPDRFSAARSLGRDRLAFIPFGAGARQCIGMNFALMEATFATAILVQRLRPRLVPGHRVVPASASTLKPRYGMKMQLERLVR